MFPSAETAERRNMVVGDVKLSKLSGQRFAIVLRVGTRSRHGPDVGNKRDIRLLQQAHEFRDRPRSVSNGKDGEIHTPPFRSLDYIWANRLRNCHPSDLHANGCGYTIFMAL